MAGDDQAKLVASRFGPRLKELRAAAGLSQKKLAELAGISQPVLSDYENGRYAPGWDVVVALAYALGVPVGAFTVAAATLDDRDSDN